MKFLDDHLLGGLFIGITVGLQFGSALSTYAPVFLVLTILILLRHIVTR